MPSTTHPHTSWGYRPQLDGLRCLAVYLVLLFHAEAGWFDGGFIGVDLFFVLSGFLVTNVILTEVDEHDRFSIGRFYARRVRRLLPAAVVAIAVTCLVQLLVASEPVRLPMVRDAQAALLYVANWQFIHDANDYFASGVDSSPFLHFWSLSIEEQYYVVYPLLLFLLLVVLRWSQRRVGVVLAVLAAASVAAQVHAAGGDINYAYYATHTRIYQPLVGCLLAIALRELGTRPARRRRRGGAVVAGAGVLGVLGVVVLGSSLLELSQRVRGLLCTVAAATAIGGVVLAPRMPVARLLALAWPRYLGQISYGTYLWHWPVLLVLVRVLDARPVVMAALAGAVATGLAAASAPLLEVPIRRTRRLGRAPWAVVGLGLVTSVLVATVVVPATLHRSQRPVLVAGTVPGAGLPPTLGHGLDALREPVPDDIDYAALRKDDGEVGPKCSDGTAASCVVVDGDGPLVVLIGDSHAAMLAPALRELAEEQGFRFSTDIMNNCPWQRGLSITKTPLSLQQECADMRADFYDHILPTMGADLVVVAGTNRISPGWKSQVAADDADDHPGETYDQMWARTSQDTVTAIRDAGPRVEIMHTVFGTGGYEVGGFDPLDCLARADRLADCAVVPPQVGPPVDAVYTWMATTMPGVFTVDYRDAYCPGEVLCAPVVDGHVVWHDLNHLSTDYVVSIRDQIWSAIEASGAVDDRG